MGAKIIPFLKPKLDPIHGDSAVVARMVAMLDAPLDQVSPHFRDLVEVISRGIDRLPPASHTDTIDAGE